MCLEECPLSDVCKQRRDVANAVLNSENQSASRQVDSLTKRIYVEIGNDTDNGEQTVAQFHASKLMFHETLSAVRRSLGNLGLALQISGEASTQAFEQFNCPGAIKKRQFGFFGKVMELACGSESRVDRLKDHLVRLEPPDEWTVEN